MSSNTLSAQQKTDLVIEILKFMVKHELIGDSFIYADNKCFSFNEIKDSDVITASFGTYHIRDNVDVRAMVEYSNPDTITITSEGAFYYVMNGETGYEHIQEEFNNILAKYNLYYEQGYSWSLSCYFDN